MTRAGVVVAGAVVTSVLVAGFLFVGTGTTHTVDASKYDAFWLWSGVVPQPVLDEARTVYVLHGQVAARRDGAVGMTSQGTVPRLRRGDVWVVYRAHTLRWPEKVYATMLQQLERWTAAGNPVVGVQIDFDANAAYLDEYAAFLRELRRRLPGQYRLGITGLLDWGANADPAVVSTLAGVVDEVVVQTYQGRSTITDYEAYLPRVARLTIPFKIGIIQHGEWREPGYLTSSPWFRGYVVFLQNPRA